MPTRRPKRRAARDLSDEGPLNREEVALNRETISYELSEFIDDFFVAPSMSLPPYVTTIAKDAGLDLAVLRRWMGSYRRLDATGKGGGAAADRLAQQMGRFMGELSKQVDHASTGQVLGYIAARSRWIES